MDPYYFYAFLFTKLGEIHSVYIYNIVQVGAYLVFSQYRSGVGLS